jgi:hypothetical protein
MARKSHSLLLAAGLIAAPLCVAVAQQNNPTGNLGSNNSVTATPGTANNHAASGMNTGDMSRGTTTGSYGSNSGTSTMSSTSPGATGRTVVPGSTSSEANSSLGTANQRSGATGGSGSGGGAK